MNSTMMQSTAGATSSQVVMLSRDDGLCSLACILRLCSGPRPLEMLSVHAAVSHCTPAATQFAYHLISHVACAIDRNHPAANCCCTSLIRALAHGGCHATWKQDLTPQDVGACSRHHWRASDRSFGALADTDGLRQLVRRGVGDVLEEGLLRSIHGEDWNPDPDGARRFLCQAQGPGSNQELRVGRREPRRHRIRTGGARGIAR